MSRQTTPLYIHIPGPHNKIHTAGRPDESNQQEGWTPSAHADPELIGDAETLRLAVNPMGPLRLGSPDGSLGRLTLPRGVAVDTELRVYLIDHKFRRVLIHDPSRNDFDPDNPFQPIPLWVPAWAAKPDADTSKASLAADDRSIYVADGIGSVCMFAQETWILHEIWKLEEPPVDVAVWKERVYLLTSNKLLLFEPGDIEPKLVKERPDADGHWRRMAVDSEGLVYVLHEGEFKDKETRKKVKKDALRLIDLERRNREEFFDDPGQVRNRFPEPAIVSWPATGPKGPLFLMPSPLTEKCDRVQPDLDPATHSAAGIKPPGLLFDQQGRRLPEDHPLKLRDRLFLTSGKWISQRLDSRLFHCAWDVLELELDQVPPGTEVTVGTKTTDQDVDSAPGGGWDQVLALAGSPDPSVSVGTFPMQTALINSPPGRFLWIEITMRGSGYNSPALKRINLKLPRQSFTRYLPPVLLQDEQSRRFLERFLAVFQEEWDDLEHRVDDIAGLMDPRAVPKSHLDFLAGWLGESLGVEWSEEVRRDFLKRLPKALFAERGAESGRAGGTRRATLGGLRDYLRSLLWAIRGEGACPTGNGDSDDPFPCIIEGFRDRDYRLLPIRERAHIGRVVLGRGVPESAESQTPVAPLWGADTRERFQLGQSSRLDESRLMPDDSADLDIYLHHAHRFRVVVPSALISTADEEALLRRAVEAEKPAHTMYELELVGARFRIGVQSTVGIDTILGGIPRAYLGNPNSVPRAAPSAPPIGALGFDTVLSESPRREDRLPRIPEFRIEGAVRL